MLRRVLSLLCVPLAAALAWLAWSVAVPRYPPRAASELARAPNAERAETPRLSADADVGARIASARTATSAVEGKVVDWTGAAVADARVLAQLVERDGAAARELAALTTDGAGAFSISGAPLGILRLQASAPRFGASWVLEVENDGRRAIDWLELALQSGARIEGRVRDVDGFPIEGCIVELAGRALLGEEGPPRTATDAQGFYSFEGVQVGAWTVRAVPDDAATTRESRRVLAEEKRVTVRGGTKATVDLGGAAKRPLVLFGRIDDVERAPGELHVDVWRARRGERDLAGVAAVRSDGAFQVEVPEPGSWIVSLETYSRCLALRRVEVADVARVEVTLAWGSGVVSGRVLDARGARVGPRMVLVRARAGAETDPFVAVWSTEDGAFEARDLAAGEYDVVALREAGAVAPVFGVWHEVAGGRMPRGVGVEVGRGVVEVEVKEW